MLLYVAHDPDEQSSNSHASLQTPDQIAGSLRGFGMTVLSATRKLGETRVRRGALTTTDVVVQEYREPGIDDERKAPCVRP